MPLPLGHTAIGLATFKTMDHTASRGSNWKLLVWLTLLANLPDIDVIPGLLLQGNGNLFHRGPTHSLLVALASGWLASWVWRFSRHIPRLAFRTCFMIVFSHVLADMLFTAAPVSLFWPLEVYWSDGSSGWGQIARALVFDSFRDFGILLGVSVYIGILALIRKWFPDLREPVLVRRRIR